MFVRVCLCHRGAAEIVRPAKPALTRESIVGTAVMLMGAEGLNRVTMRRLAQELDTGAASLYVYVRNTAELHAAILDDLLGGLDLSPVKGRRLADAAGDDPALVHRAAP
ncbi:helix-turn-helix domain-containing protein [Fodinicola feengrottensis]|uniref:helix-turn-helix domain-containing protein n=1 Tax=Fodinicola feengrottensis TaxID=435914 RepID=UPI002442BD93|nr:helix-turn-helix domain containing protein [Fodinicola feengrottensis]